MNKKFNKKGFTIVELVIVIAVIAILAAVLIPTFSNLVQKANRSADIQAVRQMNTQLAMVEANTFDEAIKQLDSADIDADNYKALSKGMRFYWIKSLNKVVLADANKKVSWPEELTEQDYALGDWWSLSGEVETAEVTIANKAVDVASGAELVSVIDKFNKGEEITTINLTGDIDLMGAAMNFHKIEKNLTVNGGNSTIYGLRNGVATRLNAKNGAGVASEYGYGLFGSVEKGIELTVSNLKISGAVVDASIKTADEVQAGHAGVLVGVVYGTLNANNVTIENCIVNVEKKAGALIGFVHNKAKVTLNNITISNCQVYAGREGAQVVGYLQNTNKGTTFTSSNITVTNVTVAQEANYGLDYDATTNRVTESGNPKLGVTNAQCWYVTDVIENMTATQGQDLPQIESNN